VRVKESKIEDRGSTIAIRPPPSSIFHPWLLVLVALYLIFLHSTLANALEIPRLRGRINDYAGLIPADRAQALERRLAAFEQETGHQIAVLTIPSLEGDPLEDFSIRVAESWKIGTKGFDNGAILLFAQKERKIRIEVGRGFEGILPDAVASRIIREVIAPRSREGDEAGGIEAGLNSIIEATRGERLPSAPHSKTRASRHPPTIGLLGITTLFALLVGIGQRSPLRGGFGGAISGGVIGSPAAWWSGSGAWIALVLAGAVIGALANFYSAGVWGRPWTVRRARRESWPRDTIYYGGSGDGSVGSDFGGGGFGGDFGGGGFSGGGGDFGGGGASGDG